MLIALAFNLSAQQNQQSENAPIYFKQKGVDSAPLNYARAQWDIIGEFDATSASQAGIETDGNHFFLPKWNDPAIVQYDMDGSNATEVTIPGISGLRDLAYVESTGLFYGSDASMNLYVIDLNNQVLVQTIAVNLSGITGIRHIAYDPNLDNNNGGFWIGNWSDLGAIDMEGNELVTGAPILKVYMAVPTIIGLTQIILKFGCFVKVMKRMTKVYW